MKIQALRIKNYRTLVDVVLKFPASYSAICGPNDCGKTNVVRAIRALMEEESPFEFTTLYDTQEVTLKKDYPKWMDTPSSEKKIQLELTLEINQDRDAGFYQFLVKQLSLETEVPLLVVAVEVTHGFDRSEPEVRVRCLGDTYAGLEAQEVLKRLQSSRSILFHNSTQVDAGYMFSRGFGGQIRAESAEHEALIARMRKTVIRGLAKISKTYQKELEELLGRLETKYTVGLSMPAFDFSSVPYSVTLGQKNLEVPLEDWGSGTANRTLILMKLFRAKQLDEAETSASKVSPVIVIEEPECFLHPSAQAEFGRVLHDLSEEFQVQVIVTTHSPYLLNMENPSSNLLLRRRSRYKQLLETERVDTSGDDWVQPFSLALGLESEEFKPWKELLLADAAAILLVEGESDKEYFEMLRDSAHAANRLEFGGDIVSYDGTGSLKNTVLLRFIKNRYAKLFVTYDLDAEDQVAGTLKTLGLEKRKNFAPVGLNEAGKRMIEGLLPESVITAVYSANPDVMQAATSGNKEERESAKKNLKKLLLAEFKKKASPGQEYFGHFYALVKLINRALGS